MGDELQKCWNLSQLVHDVKDETDEADEKQRRSGWWSRWKRAENTKNIYFDCPHSSKAFKGIIYYALKVFNNSWRIEASCCSCQQSDLITGLSNPWDNNLWFILVHSRGGFHFAFCLCVAIVFVVKLLHWHIPIPERWPINGIITRSGRSQVFCIININF